jgi:hypothetical protein
MIQIFLNHISTHLESNFDGLSPDSGECAPMGISTRLPHILTYD